MSNAVELFILIGDISHVDLLYTFVSNKLDQLLNISQTVRVRSDRMRILKKYAYGPDRTRTVQILIRSGTYIQSL